MKALPITLFFLFGSFAFGQIASFHGGPTPKGPCLEDVEYRAIHTELSGLKTLKLGPLSEDMSFGYLSKEFIRFKDPMGGGGTNSFGKTLVNYVDQDPNVSHMLDYYGGDVTYDSHRGTDIEILDFYDMDEGAPVLCASRGLVIYKWDGEYDRHSSLQPGAIGNAVKVLHNDGSEAWYWHFKKNSITVKVGDWVLAGDILGMVGSSGYSTNPHIHFEIQEGGVVVDPFHGPFNPEPTLWKKQPPYVLNLPFELMHHGLTTTPLSWSMVLERPPTKTHVKDPDLIYSWLRPRNIQANDVLTWKVYENGDLWYEANFTIQNTYVSSWWYAWFNLPDGDPSQYGNWSIEIYRNNDLIAIQNFVYDDQQNQIPIIEDDTYHVPASEPFEGEFLATDPDGSIFWYEVETMPEHGSLLQFGGRKRKFEYVPNPGFTGQDKVVFYALDDEMAKGSNGTYTFNVY